MIRLGRKSQILKRLHRFPDINPDRRSLILTCKWCAGSQSW